MEPATNRVINSSKSASLWQLGFRPFFLFGAAYAALAIALWVSFLGGWISRPGLIDPVLWHSHEMIYGFAAAIVVGFVLTASQNWTGIRGVHGNSLKILVLLWAAARIAISLPFVPLPVVAIVDLAFFPVAAYLMVPYLKDPELKAEKLFFVFYGLLFAGNLLVHLETTGLMPGYGRRGIFLGLDVIIIVIVFMGGRVIPFFTESSVARAQPKTRNWVEIGSHASAALFLVTDLFLPSSWPAAAVAISAGAIHFLRLWGWQVRRIRRIPLIWVLHLAYLWLVIGFVLSGLAALDLFQKTMAVHAFTVGCLGMIIYGMITRVSLGHTGRRLHPRAAIVVGYYLLLFAAVVRVFVPAVLPRFYTAALLVSGSLWIAAFVLFLIVYSPMLLAPRSDGRPG